MKTLSAPPGNTFTEFLLYKTSDGKVKVEIFLHDANIWLTQKKISELFSVTVPTINEHLKNIFKSKELDEESAIRNFRTTATDGKKYCTSQLIR